MGGTRTRLPLRQDQGSEREQVVSYFPRATMPLTEKKNAPGSIGAYGRVRILADEYNMHDQEILAIEQYLGTNASYPVAGSRTVPANLPQGQNNDTLFNSVARLVDNLNAFSDPAAGANCSSGFVVSGKRPIMPPPTQATFLSDNIVADGSSVPVSSVVGFPKQGIISIPNPMILAVLSNGTWVWQGDVTTMEWIKYSDIKGNSFTGCQRGYLGTTAKSHSWANASGVDDKKNIRDYTGDVTPPEASSPNYPTRRNPAWKTKSTYDFPLLNMSGDLVILTWRLARQAKWLRVPNQPSQPDSVNFAAVANGLGILATRSDGTYYLVSTVPAYAALGELSWSEASSLVTGLIADSVIVLKASPNDQIWPLHCVPVYQGKLGLQYSSIWLGAGAESSNGYLGDVQLTQTSEGNLHCFTNSTDSSGLVSVVGYQAFVVASPAPQVTISDQAKLPS